ncbi:hypothetical protein BKI52_08835 [marine bacterium AO1-C]|nr:hypothetical protein BKI52_08835 [marine bacterium AO1-C]
MDTFQQKLIYEGKNSLIYLQPRGRWESAFVAKVLKNDFPTIQQIDRFNNEYEFTRRLHIPGIRKVYRTDKYQNKFCLIMEYIEGVTLRQFFQNHSQNLGLFLKVAIQIAQILDKVHKQHIIHKDINPNNILIHTKTHQITLIDFGISSKISQEKPHIENPEHLEGTLAYISPEQTGRMQRVVDHRADLYSLGITFYELLTGGVPFQHNNPIEIVHAHIAQKPRSISKTNAIVPEVLSNIVMKLMEKNAEDRYQSAQGLLHDLEKCLDWYNLESTIPNFEVGQNDFVAKLSLDDKLYGRDQELHQLLQAYHQVCGGSKELMLIQGESGVGKTALVQQFQKDIAHHKGYFVAGKFDQFQRNIPYYAITQALNQLCAYILAENEATVKQWKHNILEALGNYGKALTDIIPLLELVIGKQPKIPDTEGKKKQTRFEFLFQNFIRAISQSEHPLVLFIDDLQWADEASLRLLQNLLEDPENAYLMGIGAYRNTADAVDSRIVSLLKILQSDHTLVSHIQLLPLTIKNIEKILSDAMHQMVEPTALEKLAALVHTKTKGNAYFTVEFLKTLIKQKLINFDKHQKQWYWNLDQIDQKSYTDNVIDLMTTKITSFATNIQQVLKIASCIGNQFELKTLFAITNQPQSQTIQQLMPIAEEGLIVPLNRHRFLINSGNSIVYKFAHDRVQQAVYELIEVSEKKAIHLSIGRFLLNHIAPQKLYNEYLFDLTIHFMIGLEVIHQPEEKIRLSTLFLKAGIKAKNAGAYQSASEYFQIALEMQGAQSWEHNYQVTLEIYHQLLEIAFLRGNYKTMNKLINIVLQRAHHLLDKIPAYRIKISANMAQERYLKAIEIALQVLKDLGVKLPQKSNKRLEVLASMKVSRLLGKIPASRLIELPPMTDPEQLAIMRILNMVMPPALVTTPHLSPAIILKMMQVSLTHGTATDSTIGYAYYGLLLCIQGKVLLGFEIGKSAIQLLDHIEDKSFQGRTLSVYNIGVSHWKEPLKNTIPQLAKAYNYAVENGDLEFAGYAIIYKIFGAYFSGKHLNNTYQDILHQMDILQRHRQNNSLNGVEIFRQTILYLKQDFLTLPSSSSIQLNDALFVEETKKRNDHPALYYTYLNLSNLAYLFEEYSVAYDISEKAQAYKAGVIGQYSWTLWFYHHALIIAAILNEKKGASRKKLSKQLWKHLKTLKKWASHNPDNYLHKYHLVQAEIYRINNKTDQAIVHYGQAIQLAQQHEFLQEEALANELTARFWFDKDQSVLAMPYLQRAYYLYGLWGAKAKTDFLEKKYASFLQKKPASQTSSTQIEGSTTDSTHNELLDMASILKASQTISQEVRFDNLIEKMLQVVLETSGAQRGILIDNNEGKLELRARGDAQSGIRVLKGKPLEKSNYLSQAVVHYVARTKETLLLGDATQEKRFAQDAYIQAKKPRSLLCFPVLRKDEVSVIFYLENRLSLNTFNPERLETLKILSSQIVISIENALLYEKLEEKVKERTEELSLKNQEISATAEVLQDTNNRLQKRNKEITASIHYAQRIQEAVLSFEDRLLNKLPKHFVFFQPRDVVSGDFYWFEAIDNKMFFIAADCTQHGVSGAFMTMLGTQALANIIGQKKIHSPALILQALDESMEILLQSKQTMVRDGMEIAVCVIDQNRRTLQFAGALSPMVLIQDGKLKLIKGNLRSINGYRNEKEKVEFTNHTFELTSSVSFYIRSDGIQDQFGGPKYKKFTPKRLHQLLLEIHHEAPESQSKRVAEAISQWQGDHEQIDDMLLIGVKVDPHEFPADELS